jgi:hypothetical protein
MFSARDTNQGKEYSRGHRKDFFDNRDGDETPECKMSVMAHLMCARTQTRSTGASGAQRASRPSSNRFGVDPLV